MGAVVVDPARWWELSGGNHQDADTSARCFLKLFPLTGEV